MTRTQEARDIEEALAKPFETREVKFKPQMVKDKRCLAMAYIDARLVQDRLDEVVGVENWQDDYEVLPDGSVMCKLTVDFGSGCQRTKCDVGSMSEQPDGGDRLKAAFSDALKRAAIKFGIGRYLYRLEAQWVDYDPVKKRIVTPPQLPSFAIPRDKPRESLDKLKKQWQKSLSAIETADELNQIMIKFRLLSTDEMNHIRPLIMEVKNDKNLGWDEKTKKFLPPPKEKEI